MPHSFEPCRFIMFLMFVQTDQVLVDRNSGLDSDNMSFSLGVAQLVIRFIFYPFFACMMPYQRLCVFSKLSILV